MLQLDTYRPKSLFPFKYDQCAYTNVTAKGLSQLVRMKHMLLQVDGNFKSEEEVLQTDGNTFVPEVEEEVVHKCT